MKLQEYINMTLDGLEQEFLDVTLKIALEEGSEYDPDLMEFSFIKAVVKNVDEITTTCKDCGIDTPSGTGIC